MNNKFDKDRVKIVDINEVAFNPWNPKVKRSKEYEKVYKSIQVEGILSPIIVREIDDEDFKYQVLDGEQKLTALLDLGEDTAPIYNLGHLSDEKAKQVTIFMMQHVDAEQEALGKLLVELQDKVELPYDIDEIEVIAGVDVDDEEDSKDDFELKSNFVKYSASIIKEWSDFIKQKVRKITDDFNCSEGVALYYMVKNSNIGEIDGEEIKQLSQEESDKQF